MLYKKYLLVRIIEPHKKLLGNLYDDQENLKEEYKLNINGSGELEKLFPNLKKNTRSS